MTVDMSQFYQVFFDEANELLAEKERLLLEIDVDHPSADDLNAIFRTAHSIKGGAATFGFSDITEFTHVLESLLDRIRKGEMPLTTEHVDAFLAAKDVLSMLIDGHRIGATVDAQQVQEVSRRLHALAADQLIEPVAVAEVPVAGNVKPEPESEPELVTPEGHRHLCIDLPADVSDRDVASLIQELSVMGDAHQRRLPDGSVVFDLITDQDKDTIEAVCTFVVDAAKLVVREHVPTVKASEPPVTIQTEPEPVTHEAVLPAAVSVVEDVNKKLQKRETEKQHASTESSSIRVNTEKVDLLINLVGELVITQAMIDQRASGLDPVQHEMLLNSIAQLSRNTRDLQESVMSIRMMPMDYVFSRFPRMVRELAGKLGKQVEFITQGASTELDKGLIERIIDPLTHLVRNSVDHGIELPEVRRKNGKPETGKLTLSASHQGGNIVIEVTDDGAGLNRERILAKAKQNGLPVQDNMPDEDVWQLIFMPGFSTADVVTDVSGRGVGMDVVRRNITNMGGAVEIRSVDGRGSAMRISVPLTLAILDGMSVKVGNEIYIVPLAYVVESLQPVASDLKEVAGSGRLLKVREEYLPLFYLYEVFGIVPSSAKPTEGIVLVLTVDDKKSALLVDTLLGQQQVVVKNLETNFRKVPGISGATILGDGGVSLILDVAALTRGLV
jgi:two-component system chemotaxis sensor kinase CheA